MRRLEFLRVQQGWTRQDLSAQSGVSISAIFDIERGYSQGLRLTLAALSKALKWPPERMLELREEVAPEPQDAA